MSIVETVYWGALYILLGVLCFSELYYLLFAAVYFLLPSRSQLPMVPQKRFLIIIPAHNEERLIQYTLEQALKVEYPSELFKLVVVADNCTDHTASLAIHLGISVLERVDNSHRGKGYALAWAMARLSFQEWDAVVIIDADTGMHREYLKAMNAALCDGYCVLQGYNDLLNPNETYLTRLIHVTSVMKNLLLNEGKTKLGFPVSLMGTGMCFESSILEKFGWNAFSIGEDWEYSALLADQSITVKFVASAITFAQEASTFQQAFSQRIRWAGGKFEVAMRKGWPALWEGLKGHNLHKLDAATSLLLPTFSQLAYLNILAIVMAFMSSGTPKAEVAQKSAMILMAGQVLYFCFGLIAMKASWTTIASVCVSPLFLLWKLGIDILALAGYKRNIWERTKRKKIG